MTLSSASTKAATGSAKGLLPTPLSKPSFFSTREKGTTLEHEKPTTSIPFSNSKGVFGRPNLAFKQKLTPEELEECRTKNLCYYCREKYTPGHECSSKKRLQLFMMEVIDEPDDEEDAELMSEPREPRGSQAGVSDHPTISLNAMQGESGVGTMRVVGQVGKRVIHILIDTGSTHNFIDISVARDANVKTQNISPLMIAVAGGNSLWVYEQCPSLALASHGIHFHIEVYLLPLAGYDMVIGMQWLRELGTI